MRMKQFRFMSSSSQSKSIVLPPGCPKFLKGLRNGLRMGLRNGLWKGLWNGLNILCWPRRPGSEATLTWKKAQQQTRMTSWRLQRSPGVWGPQGRCFLLSHWLPQIICTSRHDISPQNVQARKENTHNSTVWKGAGILKNEGARCHFHPIKCCQNYLRWLNYWGLMENEKI